MGNETHNYNITDACNLIGNFITDVLNCFGYYDTYEQCISLSNQFSLKEDIEHKRTLSNDDITDIISKYNGISIDEIIIGSIIMNGEKYINSLEEYQNNPKEYIREIQDKIPCKLKSNGKAKSEKHDILVHYKLGTDRKVQFTKIIDLGSHKKEIEEINIVDNIEYKYERFLYGITKKFPKFMGNRTLTVNVENLAKASNLSVKEVAFFIKLLAQPQFNVWDLQKSTLNRNNLGSVQVLVLHEDMEIPLITGYDASKGFTYSTTYKIKTTKNICTENEEYMKNIGKRYNIILPTIYETNLNMISLPDGEFGLLNERIFTGMEQSENSIFSRRLYNMMQLIDTEGNSKFVNNIRAKKKLNPNYKDDNLGNSHAELWSKIVYYTDLTEYEVSKYIEESIVLDEDGNEKIIKTDKKKYANIDVCSSRLLQKAQQTSKRVLNTDGRDFSYTVCGTKIKVYEGMYDMNFTVEDLFRRINYLFETGQMSYEEFQHNMYQYNQMVNSFMSCYFVKGNKQNERCEKYAENYVDKWHFKFLGDCKDITFADFLKMPLKTVLALEMEYSFIERNQIINSKKVIKDVKSFAMNILNNILKIDMKEINDEELYIKNRVIEYISKQYENKGLPYLIYKDDLLELKKLDSAEEMLLEFYKDRNLWENTNTITSLIREFRAEYNAKKMEYKEELDRLQNFEHTDRLTLREKNKIYRIVEQYNKITGKDLEIKNFKVQVKELLSNAIEQNKNNCNKLKYSKEYISDKKEKKKVNDDIKLLKTITKTSRKLERNLNKSKKLPEYTDYTTKKQNIKFETLCSELFDNISEIERDKDMLEEYNVDIKYLIDLKPYLIKLLNREYEIRKGESYTICNPSNLVIVCRQVATI